jgi:amino acid transporter
VIIAALTGLALGVLSQASSVISTGYITPLDTFNPFNAGIIGYWVGALGFAPLVFIVIAVASTARKAGLRNSIFNGIGAILGVSFVIAFAVIAVAASHPKKELPFAEVGAERAEFVKGTSSSCIRSQQAKPENQSLSAATLDAYCTCYANSLADVTTTAEIQYTAQYHTPAPSMVEKINATFQKCVQASRSRQ